MFSRLAVAYYIAYPQRMAGANRSLFELVTHLPDRVQPVVVSVAEGRAVDAYREAGVDVHIAAPGGRLAAFGKAAMGWSTWEKAGVVARELVPYTRRLRALFRALSPDVIHTNDPRGTLLAGPAARLLGVPLVSHLRGEIPFGGTMAQAYEALPHRFVAVSQATATALSPRARQRATAVYNGTRDVAGEGPTIAWLDTLRAHGVVVVAVFASVVPFKGHHHLLRAVDALRARGLADRFAVVCVGDLDADHPDYVRWVGQLRAELGVNNVTFAGWQDDPFAFYRSADVTVLPSVSNETLTLDGRARRVLGNEGFPRTHLEAMCFGLPIVGTDIAGVREQVVDGETGFVVPPGDPEALADALARLVQDAPLRARLGAAGRARVLERFSTAAYVHGVTDVYDSLLR